MDCPMMAIAEQRQIAQRSRTTVNPMSIMMCVAPGRRPIAPREDASPVAGDQCSAHRLRHHVGRSADIERLTLGAQHHRDDPCIAGDPPGSGSRQRRAGFEQARRLPEQPQKCVVADRDDQLRSLATHIGQLPGPQLAQLDKCVRITATGIA
jgi:hypothetical protein